MGGKKTWKEENKIIITFKKKIHILNVIYGTRDDRRIKIPFASRCFIFSFFFSLFFLHIHPCLNQVYFIVLNPQFSAGLTVCLPNQRRNPRGRKTEKRTKTCGFSPSRFLAAIADRRAMGRTKASNHLIYKGKLIPFHSAWREKRRYYHGNHDVLLAVTDEGMRAY